MHSLLILLVYLSNPSCCHQPSANLMKFTLRLCGYCVVIRRRWWYIMHTMYQVSSVYCLWSSLVHLYLKSIVNSISIPTENFLLYDIENDGKIEFSRLKITKLQKKKIGNKTNEINFYFPKKNSIAQVNLIYIMPYTKQTGELKNARYFDCHNKRHCHYLFICMS